MSAAALVIAVAVAICELLCFRAGFALPKSIAEIFMAVASVFWLISPLLTLGLLAGSRSNTEKRLPGIVSLAAALLCAALSAWVVVSGAGPVSGLGVLVVPALQWLVVLTALFALSLLRAKS
jgi:hypothetical protein